MSRRRASAQAVSEKGEAASGLRASSSVPGVARGRSSRPAVAAWAQKPYSGIRAAPPAPPPPQGAAAGRHRAASAHTGLSDELEDGEEPRNRRGSAPPGGAKPQQGGPPKGRALAPSRPPPRSPIAIILKAQAIWKRPLQKAAAAKGGSGSSMAYWAQVRKLVEKRTFREWDNQFAKEEERARRRWRTALTAVLVGIRLMAKGAGPTADELEEEEQEGDLVEGLVTVRPSNRRKSALGIVQCCKVFYGISTRLQVAFARNLKRVAYGDDTEGVVCVAGDTSAAGNRLMIVGSGWVEASMQNGDGTVVNIGTFGPGTLLGALSALGVVSRQLMTIRAVRPGATLPDGTVVEDPSAVWEVDHAAIAQIAGKFQADLNVLRRRAIQDMKQMIMRCVLHTIQNGDFFRRYHPECVKRLMTKMELRVFRPGGVIFKESTPAKNMAVLFSGAVDIFVHGERVASKGKCGYFFGESALLEKHPMRAATVKCSREVETLVCLIQRDAFIATIEEFPEERARLEEHVHLKQIMLGLGDWLKGADAKFMHRLAMACEVVHLTWGHAACRDGEGEEVLHLVLQGVALAEMTNGHSLMLKAGQYVGSRGGLGLKRGAPPDYTLIAGRRGCTLVRMPYSALEGALLLFPDQLGLVLAAGNAMGSMKTHPIHDKANYIWDMLHPLLCQAFSTEDFTLECARAIEGLFRKEVYDAGVAITEEGKECGHMTFLLDGAVRWETMGIVETVERAPRYADEAVVLGTERCHAATIKALAPCVAWHLSPEDIANAASGPSASPILKQVQGIVVGAGTRRRAIQANLQARLRNMKTFRRFRSEILELISNHLDIRTFLPQQEIFAQGDEGHHVYIILQGRAEVLGGHGSGPLLEGSTFGEAVLFGPGIRTSTVRAVTLCICNAVHKDFLTYAFQQYPDTMPSVVAGGSLPKPPSRQRVQAHEDMVITRSASGRALDGNQQNSGSHRMRQATMAALMCARARSVIPGGGSLLAPDVGHSDSGALSWGSLLLRSQTSPRSPKSPEQEEASPPATLTFALPEPPRGSVLSSAGPEAAATADGGSASPQRGRAPGTGGGGAPATQRGSPQRRPLQRAGAVFDEPVPELPPAGRLYMTPRNAEAKLSSAFGHLLPPGVAATAAHMYAVRSPGSNPARVGRASSLATPRKQKGAATYTVPLPPLSARRVAARLDQAVPPVVRSRDADQSIALCGQLQALASSLLRISSKPSLAEWCGSPSAAGAGPLAAGGGGAAPPGDARELAAAEEEQLFPEHGVSEASHRREHHRHRAAALRKSYLSPSEAAAAKAGPLVPQAPKAPRAGSRPQTLAGPILPVRQTNGSKPQSPQVAKPPSPVKARRLVVPALPAGAKWFTQTTTPPPAWEEAEDDEDDAESVSPEIVLGIFRDLNDTPSTAEMSVVLTDPPGSAGACLRHCTAGDEEVLCF